MLQPGSAEIPGYFRELEQEALRAADQTADPRPLLLRSADLRYRGQGYELRVDWGRDYLSRFHRLHAERYGYADASRPVEIVTLRLQTVVGTRRETRSPAKLRSGDGKQAILKSQRVFERGRWRAARLYKRESLRPGDRIGGPAVIAEYSATTFVASGWSALVDGQANLVLSAKGRPR
jgi:N-methylhydantoinase A